MGIALPLIQITQGSGGDSDDELNLGTPDDSEAHDLVRHVGRCALRYRLLTKRLRQQGSQINRIEYILYGLAVYALGSVGPVHDFILGALKAIP